MPWEIIIAIIAIIVSVLVTLTSGFAGIVGTLILKRLEHLEEDIVDERRALHSRIDGVDKNLNNHLEESGRDQEKLKGVFRHLGWPWNGN